MKSVICILTLLCTVYAFNQDILNPMDKLERLVKLQKTVAQTILDGLTLFEGQTKKNLEVKLDELKTENLNDIHNAINEAIENINLSVEKGKQENKKTDDCYNNAKSNLETENTKAIAALETCIQNGHTAMETPLANVANSIEATKKMLTELDAIIPNCYSINILERKACVVKNLLKSNTSLKNIGSNAKEVATSTAVTYAKMIINVRSCITTLIADTRTFGTDIVIHADDCIRNAPANIQPTDKSKFSYTASLDLTIV